MKAISFVLAVLLAGAGSAFGAEPAKECSSWEVQTIPFSYAEDTGKTAAEISAMTNYKGRFGVVIAVAYASVKACRITLGYKEAVLYVARELRADTCAFSHVREHELVHVALYEAALEGMAERVSQRVARGEQPRDAVMHEFDSVAAQHAQHDSPWEYRKNATACRGRILALAGG